MNTQYVMQYTEWIKILWGERKSIFEWCPKEYKRKCKLNKHGKKNMNTNGWKFNVYYPSMKVARMIWMKRRN